MDFSRRCGLCYNEFSKIKSGFILCCGDFICFQCDKINAIPNQCPLCKKDAPDKIDLSNTNEIPEEVAIRLDDSTNIMEKLYETMEFQVKNYKRLIKGLIMDLNSKNRMITALKEENARMKSYGYVKDSSKDMSRSPTPSSLHSRQSQSDTSLISLSRRINDSCSNSQLVPYTDRQLQHSDSNPISGGCSLESGYLNKSHHSLPRQNYNTTPCISSPYSPKHKKLLQTRSDDTFSNNSISRQQRISGGSTSYYNSHVPAVSHTNLHQRPSSSGSVDTTTSFASGLSVQSNPLPFAHPSDMSNNQQTQNKISSNITQSSVHSMNSLSPRPSISPRAQVRSSYASTNARSPYPSNTLKVATGKTATVTQNQFQKTLDHQSALLLPHRDVALFDQNPTLYRQSSPNLPLGSGSSLVYRLPSPGSGSYPTAAGGVTAAVGFGLSVTAGSVGVTGQGGSQNSNWLIRPSTPQLPFN